MSISKNSVPITTLEEWLEHAGPKNKDHWQNGRSAKETARCWLAASSPTLPREVAAALSSRGEFGQPQNWVAEPEVRLSFDEFPGETRNTDLLVEATDRHGTYLIAIEAKGDETFSETVAEALEAAIERKLGNPRSNGVARIEKLAAVLLGPRQENEASIGTLRYQLLTATAGAIAAARKAKVRRVVFLVQEFHTHRTADSKHAENAIDLQRFVARLSHGDINAMAAGHLYGPIAIPANPLFDRSPDLYIGRVICNLRTREP